MTTNYFQRCDERNKKLLDFFLHTPDLKKCSKKFGINVASTREALKKVGLKFPKTKLRSGSACNRNRNLVFRLCNDGLSLSKIGRRIGTSGRHVKRFLRENGIEKKFLPWSSKEKHYNWKGGRFVDRHGYVLKYSPNHPHRRRHIPYVLEHRLVMELMIGRFLFPKEVVHHKNGNRSDNRPKNLQLFSENGKHLAFELKGRIPKWTDKGMARIKRGARLRWKKWRLSVAS